MSTRAKKKLIPNPPPQFNDTKSGDKKLRKFLLRYVDDERDKILEGIENRKKVSAMLRKQNAQRRRHHAAKGEYYVDEKTPPLPMIGLDYIEKAEKGYVEDYYDRLRQEKAIMIDDYENEVLKLIRLRTKYERDIDDFDPSKPRQKQKIVFAQFEIRKINQRLAEIEDLTGIVYDAINNDGPKGRRVWKNVKKTTRRVFNAVTEKLQEFGKGVKKFFKKYSDAVIAICSLATPLVVSALFGPKAVAA